MVQFDDRYSGSKITDMRSQEEERFVQTIAAQNGFDYVNLRGYTINPEGLALVEEHKARLANLVCFDVNHNNVSVAMKDPNDPKVQEILKSLITRRYTPTIFMCSSQSLEHAWKRYSDIVSSSAEKKGVFEISAEDILALVQSIKSPADIVTILKKISTVNNTRRISQTLELIFAGAIALKASDVHIEPEETGIRLRYRFDGVLHDVVDLDSYIHDRMLSRLKLLSGMILNSKAAAQDGRFTFEAGDKQIEVRSSVIPGSFGESVVMRILDPSVASFSMENLRLNTYIETAIRDQLKKPNGLIVTTGPTGAGKTTALYAFLREAHNEGVKIITIENPVEYKIDGIVQTQTDENYTFASGLRAVLRQDPDIIMVGEIRDLEVAETAIHAAQTGHLVFTTLHTNSAAAAFPRMIDLGIDPRIFGTSINIMLGQRLVRVLCKDCRESYPASLSEIATIKNVMAGHPHPIKITEPINLYRSVGCTACSDTGYKGRAAIFEGIIMDDAVEEAVIKDPREHIIIEAAKPQKLPSMLEDGIEKVLSGLTAMSELERVIEIPHPLESEISTKTPPASGDVSDDFESHVIS